MEARATADHPARHRTAPATKNDVGEDVSPATGEIYVRVAEGVHRDDGKRGSRITDSQRMGGWRCGCYKSWSSGDVRSQFLTSLSVRWP